MTSTECACGCGRPAPGAALAPQCAAALRHDLRRLPALDRDLEALSDPRRAVAHRGGGGEGALPFDEAAAGCRAQAAAHLRYWTAMVADARQPAARPALTVAAMAGWLHGQATWIIRYPCAADMAAQLRADCGRARALLDPLRRAVIPLPGRCPECGSAGTMAATVPKDDGDLRPSVITCAGCGHAWDTTQWLKLGHVLLQQREAA